MPNEDWHFRRLGCVDASEPSVGIPRLKLSRVRSQNEKVFTISHQQFNDALQKVIEILGLQHLGIVCHSWRHAGPSWDAQMQFRTQTEIQRHGRWRSPASVIRYERSSRVLAALATLSDPMLGWLRLCEQRFCSYVRDGAAAPDPPTLIKGNSSLTCLAAPGASQKK